MKERELVAIITAILVAPEDRLGKALGAARDKRLEEWVQTARDIVQASRPIQ